MKHSMESKNKVNLYLIAGSVGLILLTAASLFIGKYRITLTGLIAGDSMQWRVFLTLRASRAVIGAIGGFVLGMAGFCLSDRFSESSGPP